MEVPGLWTVPHTAPGKVLRLGLFGFVLGVYVAELVRLREHTPAWRTTVEAMKGTGLAMLISLCATVAATAVWATAAITT